MARSKSKLVEANALRVLSALPKPLDTTAPVDRIAACALLSRTETQYRLRDLRDAGLIELKRQTGYYLTPKGLARLELAQKRDGERPVHSESLRQRLWNAARVLGKWDRAGLGECALRPDDEKPDTEIFDFLNDLLVAEVIQELPRRPNQPPRYRLARDLGPIAPTWRPSFDSLFDWNSGKPVLPLPPREVQP